MSYLEGRTDRSRSAIVVFIAAIAALTLLTGQAGAVMLSEDAAQPNPTPPAMQVVSLSPGEGGGGLVAGGQQSSNLGSFSINIVPGAGLAANAPALAAFQRAAQQWEAYISDPITVNINADLSNLGSSSIIGQTSTVLLTAGYSLVRDAMVADAADELDDAITASLPTAAQFSATVPVGMGLSGLSAAKANFKALGFTGLDSTFGSNDATITFNTLFAFDFDNSNGVTASTMDFETVAAHELGHALGFLSVVDEIDWLVEQGQTDDVYPRTLDLFRFENDQGGADPSNLPQFTMFPRNFVPGVEAILDEITPVGFDGAEELMSTGYYNGDTRQASHWKDGDLSGDIVGIMDPTLAYQQILPMGVTDLRALDLIGYEVDIASIPEPASMGLLLAGMGLLLRRRSTS